MAALRFSLKLCVLTLAFACALTVSLAQVPAQPMNEPPANVPEELTRGPVHEAFGKPVTFNPKPGLTVPQAPPAPVEELPPEEKPEGDNVSWIPGYWSYDEERNDFIWVSGFWRAVPPERQWVPGYWNQTGNGHQWVSGYWAPAKVKEAEYLAPPPDSLEAGPSTQPPSQEHIWVPGCWIWHGTRYAWRPGYWIVAQPGWIWVPAHYVWTPCGYVFCDGYWDYSLRRRGVLFAPVYISRTVYTRPGFVYSPTIIIDGDVVTEHFFVRPAYGHYYFGDYYATSYVSVGITPWFSFHYTRHCYDPVFAYYECHYRRVDPGWSVRIRADFTYRCNNIDARPPRTFVAQQTVVNNINKTKIVENKTVIKNTNIQNNGNMVLAKNIKDVAADKEAPVKFEKVAQEKRQELGKQAKEVRQAADQRVKLEGEAARQFAGRSKDDKPIKLERPSTPVVAKNVSEDDARKGKAPPPLPASAKLERKYEQNGDKKNEQKQVVAGSPKSEPIKAVSNDPRKLDNPEKNKQDVFKNDSKGKMDVVKDSSKTDPLKAVDPRNKVENKVDPKSPPLSKPPMSGSTRQSQPPVQPNKGKPPVKQPTKSDKDKKDKR